MCSVYHLSNPHHNQIKAIMSGTRSIQELVVTRSDPAQFIGQDLNRLSMLTDSLYSPSTYSIESFADESRQVDLIHPKLHHRQRSLTISTSGSSAETATNRGRLAHRMNGVDNLPAEEDTAEKSGKSSHEKTSSTRICSIQMNQSDSAPAAHLPALSVAEPADLSRRHAPVSSRLSLSIPSVASPEAVSHSSRMAAMNPEPLLRIEPRLLHHSNLSWSKGRLGEGRGEGPPGISNSGGRTFKPIDQTNPSPIDQAPLAKQHRHLPTESQSKTGLKKLVRSVKVSLWSTQTPGGQDRFNDSPVDSLAYARRPSLSQSTCSIRPVDAHPRTAAAHELSKPMSMIVKDDESESSSHIPRSFSACSYTTNSTATTSTSQSFSITPSSSCSSFATGEPDCRGVHLPGTDDGNVYEKLAPKDYSPELIISLRPSDSQRHSNMSTQTALPVLDPPARNLGSSFNNNRMNHIPSKQEPIKATPNLRSKASFGFLHNLKRAVIGNDPSLAFSFHNTMSPSLTTSAVSLPIGTVLRNNGLDPLPPCHPLPIPTSQSSPSRLDCSSSLSTSPDQLRYTSSGQSHARSVSEFLPDLTDRVNQNPKLASLPFIQPNPLLHPLGSPNILGGTMNAAQEAPTLNLRPVSMSFAAGFSDSLLLPDSEVLASEEEYLSEEPLKSHPPNTDLKPCSSQTHCPCCVTLTAENAMLKDRIRELESRISNQDPARSD